jgi:dihydropteroate synthase
MGILNVTPDSFSDGGSYLDPAQALDHARQMVADGADIIDIGGESTRPGSLPVSTADEVRRVVPIVERLAGSLPVPISIDTTKAEVARQALAAGAEIINDISGLTFDGRMAGEVAAARAGVVIMHTRGTPVEMQQNTHYTDLMTEVRSFLAAQRDVAIAAGIDPDAIVIDPGIGFGKDMQGNLQLLRELRAFESLGLPILIGTSRKGFIGRVLHRDVTERLAGTAATVAYGLMQGASIFRVHDVRAMRDVLDMTAALMGIWSGVEH